MKAPQVFKTKVDENKTILSIVYDNRVEVYEMKYSETYKEVMENGDYDEEYDRYKEIELIRNGGGREIHYQTKNIEV